MNLRTLFLLCLSCSISILCLTYLFAKEYMILMAITLTVFSAVVLIIAWLLDWIAWTFGRTEIDTDHLRRRY